MSMYFEHFEISNILFVEKEAFSPEQLWQFWDIENVTFEVQHEL